MRIYLQSLIKWFWTRVQFYLLQFVTKVILSIFNIDRNPTVGTTQGMFAINLTESHQNVPKDTKTWQKCQIEIFVEWEQFEPTWKKLNFSSFFFVWDNWDRSESWPYSTAVPWPVTQNHWGLIKKFHSIILAHCTTMRKSQ